MQSNGPVNKRMNRRSVHIDITIPYGYQEEEEETPEIQTGVNDFIRFVIGPYESRLQGYQRRLMKSMYLAIREHPEFEKLKHEMRDRLTKQIND